MRRRRFLQNSTVLALTPTLPSFLASSLEAATASKDETILVVIQLDGGNDGLNTVVPYRDEHYARSRPALRLETDQILKLTPEIGLHPRMRGMADLFEDGRLAIMQGVGYPNPNKSHFDSMAIWQAGDVDFKRHFGAGWLGQSLGNRLSKDTDPDAVFVGDRELPVALRGRRCIASSLSSMSDFDLQIDRNSLPIDSHEPDELIGFVTRSVSQAYVTAEDMANARISSDTAPSYPRSEIGQRLQLTSQLIKNNCRARVYYTAQAGYDTHANQLTTHGNLLGDFSDSLAAFLNDMRDSGLADRIVVMAFSEFGRRVTENGTGGTDHGTAGPVFIAGSRIAAGLHGAIPSLDDLDAGDLRHSVDFRSLYFALLDGWLGLRPPPFLKEFAASVPFWVTVHAKETLR